MKVIFLGTGTSQGIPVIGCNCRVCKSNDFRDQRLRSSIIISSNQVNILIDTGIDFRQQILKAGIVHLDAVLYTHEHKDHIAGLDDIRAFNFMQQKPMDVYAEDRVLRALHREFPYIFAERKYPGTPQLITHSIGDDSFTVGDIEIKSLRVWHNRLPILGYRMEDMAYITDVSKIPDSTREAMRGLKYLVIGAVRKETHYSHFSLHEALEEVERIKPGQASITHIGHLMGLHKEVEKELPENVSMAYDGMVWEG